MRLLSLPISQLRPQVVVAFLLLVHCKAELAAQLASDTGKSKFDGSIRASAAAQKLSVHIRHSARTPSWCKPRDELPAGSWHGLSDDEYSNDSPYLSCALRQSSLAQTQSQRKRLARAAKFGSSTTSCAARLPIPKVALLFLTQGAMPHEALWEKWLGSIAGLVPTLCAANAVCAQSSFQVLDELIAACGQRQFAGKTAYNQQLLYSVYIHAHPNYPLRGQDSVFFGRDSFVTRLPTRWGDHSTVEVTRRMLRAALRDPDNQRFVLLSESCVPLYSPLIIYQQLMHEWRSRISACALPGWDRSIERYNIRMGAGRRPAGRVPLEKWRKHMHWFSLVRSHAELISNDTQVVDTFARDCFTGFDILSAEPGNYRFCIGDEHYVSTLLAMHGLDSQTDCMGRLTHAAFSRDTEHPEHPRAYSVSEVNATLFRLLRGARDEVVDATNFANAAFRRIEDFGDEESSWRLPYPDLKQLKPQFYLFARKFPANTAAAVLKTLSENDGTGERLNIFGGLHRSSELPFRDLTPAA